MIDGVSMLWPCGVLLTLQLRRGERGRNRERRVELVQVHRGGVGGRIWGVKKYIMFKYLLRDFLTFIGASTRSKSVSLCCQIRRDFHFTSSDEWLTSIVGRSWPLPQGWRNSWYFSHSLRGQHLDHGCFSFCVRKANCTSYAPSNLVTCLTHLDGLLFKLKQNKIYIFWLKTLCSWKYSLWL